MSPDQGYHLTYAGPKCLSVTTGTQRDGSHQFIIHGLAGPGVERHVLGWASVTSEGAVVSGGARLKNDVLEHVGPGIQLSATTQEIARVQVTPTEYGPVTVFSQHDGDQWLCTSPSTHDGPVRRREVPLPSASSNAPTSYSIAMYDARSGVPSNTSEQVVLPFSGPVPFGLVLRALPSA